MGGSPVLLDTPRVGRIDGWSPHDFGRVQNPAYRPTRRHLTRRAQKLVDIHHIARTILYRTRTAELRHK